MFYLYALNRLNFHRQLPEREPARIITPLEIVHLLGVNAFIRKLPVVVICEFKPRIDLLPLVMDKVPAVILARSFTIASLVVNAPVELMIIAPLTFFRNVAHDDFLLLFLFVLFDICKKINQFLSGILSQQ